MSRLETGDRVEVKVALPCKTTETKWIEGVVTGFSADGWEDFDRIDVRTARGEEYRGCHPDCVRKI